MNCLLFWNLLRFLKKKNQEIALVGFIAIQEGNNLADFTNPISANYFLKE